MRLFFVGWSEHHWQLKEYTFLCRFAEEMYGVYVSLLYGVCVCVCVFVVMYIYAQKTKKRERERDKNQQK